MTAIIEATGLRKTYGDTHAMDGLDLVAQSGCLTALLGPNGAGKTTLISAVATLVKPDAGTLLVGGIDAVAHPQQVRPILGLAGRVRLGGTGNDRPGEHRARGPSLRAEPQRGQVGSRRCARQAGSDRRSGSVGPHLFGRDAPTTGPRRQPGGQPRLLLLDEPTTGLDPGSRLELWDAIRELVAGGTDVLLTTQYLEEADHLARDVIIIDHGKVIASGTPTS